MGGCFWTLKLPNLMGSGGKSELPLHGAPLRLQKRKAGWGAFYTIKQHYHSLIVSMKIYFTMTLYNIRIRVSRYSVLDLDKIDIQLLLYQHLISMKRLQFQKLWKTSIECIPSKSQRNWSTASKKWKRV